jgi:hypothetical protein
VLVYLRKGETFAEVAAGFGVSTATAWRHVNEVITLLAARAPKLGRALREAKNAGYAFVMIDGTLISIDRVAVLLGQTPDARHEHPGHHRTRRHHRMDLRSTARQRP